MNMYILYTVQKNHTGPYYRVQASFMAGVYAEYQELGPVRDVFARLGLVDCMEGRWEPTIGTFDAATGLPDETLLTR